ncbi:hypothetical protein ABW19_dt0207808 [Dactylella cylindrospora]|nr:hypothetical protein ABW19_dt0207808 [Dactylella cylindrospora]
MEASVALQTLIDCLREHNILLTRADIEWAFNTDKNVKQIVTFIQKYLNKNTLLSLEEKEIYDSLKSKDLLAPGGPSLSCRPADDQEVATDLAALELENELLKQNIDRLTALKADHEAKLKTENGHQSSLTQNREQLQLSYMSERDQNSAAIDDLEANFRAALTDLQDASGKLNFQMSAMSEITRTDDRLLARLQSIVSDILLASESGGQDLIADASQYADILATLEEQIIKTRIDRVFYNYVANANLEEMEGQPYLDVQELNDLMVEVADVAGMRAKEGLLQPIMQHLTSDNKLKTGSMAQRCNYILNTLSLLDSRNKEAESEITNRNNMQYVSGRMQMLFELSMRDFHDAMQVSRGTEPTKAASTSQQPPIDEKTYIENKLWRSMGIASLTPGEGLSKEIAGRASKLQSKEDLYKQLRATHIKYIQEEGGVVNGLENSVRHIVNHGGAGEGGGGLEQVEEKVKTLSTELGQLASLANARDGSKITIVNNLKDKEMYGS